MDKMEQLKSFKQELIKMVNLAGIKFNEEQIKIDDLGCPHTPNHLPDGKMAVYAFFCGDKCLKIGKAGPKSDARFFSQHYTGKSNSNLRKSLLADKTLEKIVSANNIENWIKEKLQRIDVLIDQDVGIFVLNFCEAFLQLLFRPHYEGFRTQRDYKKVMPTKLPKKPVLQIMNGEKSAINIGSTASSFEKIWDRVIKYQGSTFKTKKGKEFTYQINGNSFVPTGKNSIISKNDFIKAFSELPIKNPKIIKSLWGPSYIWAIFNDKRIIL